MNKLNLILGCLILAVLIIPLALHAGGHLKLPTTMRQIKRAFGYPAGQLAFNAFGDGCHTGGVLSLKADAAHSYRHLLVKTGSDADHIAVCGAGDAPLGLCHDTPGAAEDPANVGVLGATQGTALAVGAEAIAAGVDVYTAAAGELQDEPATAGTYYLVGKSVTACSGAHGEFEVTPCKPVKLIVLAALTCTNGTAAGAADLAALKTEMELATDDLRRIATAMATATLVKVLAA